MLWCSMVTDMPGIEEEYEFVGRGSSLGVKSRRDMRECGHRVPNGVRATCWEISPRAVEGWVPLSCRKIGTV